MTVTYIFDLDGTLSNGEHRLHLINPDPHSADAGKKPKKDWDAYFDACDQDDVHEDIAHLARVLADAGHTIWIWSGRTERVRDKTLAWLADHSIPFDELRMRPDNSFKPDTEIKLGWLASLSAEERSQIMGAFEDRNSVVAAWRSQGIRCFHVQDGDY